MRRKPVLLLNLFRKWTIEKEIESLKVELAGLQLHSLKTYESKIRDIRTRVSWITTMASQLDNFTEKTVT